jgi:hypothetical protein
MFENWLVASGHRREDFAPSDIQMDRGHGSDGVIGRYWIRASALEDEK